MHKCPFTVQRAQREIRGNLGIVISLCISIFNICCDRFYVFNGAEVEEMGGAMSFMVKLLWIGQLQFIVHRGRVTNTWGEGGYIG